MELLLWIYFSHDTVTKCTFMLWYNPVQFCPCALKPFTCYWWITPDEDLRRMSCLGSDARKFRQPVFLAGDRKHKPFDSYHVSQMIESHCEAVFPCWGLLVVSQHQLHVLLPHCSPEREFSLKQKHWLNNLMVSVCMCVCVCVCVCVWWQRDRN